MTLTISTWNVNSVRIRLGGIAALVEAHDPDVLCLQETKVVNDSFPLEAFEALGYTHSVINGIKSYNGVAIFSRLPLAASGTRDWCGKADGRHAWATLANGVEINNFYVPAGGNVPDPATNDKFAHKLRFLGEMINWFAARSAPKNKLVMVGDFNIAPLETDVWSHKALLKEVSHTPVEVEALDALKASHDWLDTARIFTPPEDGYVSGRRVVHNGVGVSAGGDDHGSLCCDIRSCHYHSSTWALLGGEILAAVSSCSPNGRTNCLDCGTISGGRCLDLRFVPD